jgi:hypothetical protein
VGEADDRLIVCRTRGAAEHTLQAVTQVLQKLKLTGPATKTRIVDVKSAGCECLGFHFHKGRARMSGTRLPPDVAWPESHESHTPPNSATDGTTRFEGHIDGNSGKTPPDHSGLAPLFSCG